MPVKPDTKFFTDDKKFGDSEYFSVFAEKTNDFMSGYRSDIEIALSVTPEPVQHIAEKLGIDPDDLEPYGKYKAKIPLGYVRPDKTAKSHLILVTAMTPTPAGEGKTTTSVGLNDGLNRLGKKTVVVLREPSLGPVFGIKGGAAGGGYAQVIPMEDINLHFTGDFSAVEKANNLLSALIDNHIHHGNALGIDPRAVLWKRVMDMNDRSLRDIVIGLGGKNNGMPREEGFNITPASEIMAILCLADDLADLKEKMGNILIGYNFAGEPVFARDLKAENAMAILMKDAVKPNLVQTLEHNPAIIHGGPFANIAQGTNSLIATRTGLSLADYVVTEAGFGADLGAEKFFNIKSVYGNLKPEAVVLVATLRALAYHGDGDWEKGLPNLEKHIENIRLFGLEPIVAVNRFPDDRREDLDRLQEILKEKGVTSSIAEGWEKGGAGMTDLAGKVIQSVERNGKNFRPLYDYALPVKEKIEIIAKRIYGAGQVVYTRKAQTSIAKFEKLGFGNLPVVMAKTQKSLSDNPSLKGRPEGFTINVREVEINTGAGFIIPILGKMMRMPGLPKTPASETMFIDNNGKITGLS